MGYEVIRYRAEFKSQVAELLTEFWPDPAANAAYFTWKHVDNPFVVQPLFYLLMAEDKVVGMRGFQGANWQGPNPDETFQIPCACDFVTHPEIRGKGLAHILMEHALKDLMTLGHQCVFSYSARPVPYLSQLRRGWRLAGNYRTIQRDTASVAPPGDDAFAALDALPPTDLDGGILSVAQEADAPAMSALSDAAAVPGLFRHVRHPAYVAWRFRNPVADYRFVFWRDTELRGFLVLQKQRGDAPTVRIVDWQATSAEVLKRLFNFVLEHGNFASLATWSAALPAETVSWLKDRGFASVDESYGVPDYSPGLQVKALGNSPPDVPWEIAGRCLHDFADWDLRPIYSDEF